MSLSGDSKNCWNQVSCRLVENLPFIIIHNLLCTFHENGTICSFVILSTQKYTHTVATILILSQLVTYIVRNFSNFNFLAGLWCKDWSGGKKSHVLWIPSPIFPYQYACYYHLVLLLPLSLSLTRGKLFIFFTSIHNPSLNTIHVFDEVFCLQSRPVLFGYRVFH